MKKKIFLLHPPMYPINHEFYNLLAQKVDLTIYQIGEYPVYHMEWTCDSIRKGDVYYKFKVFGKGPVNFSKTLNPSFLLDILKEKPDIVISIAFWVPSLYISILKIFCTYKFIILTNAIPQTEVGISKAKRFFRSVIAKRVDVFISASYLTTEYLNTNFPEIKNILSLQTMNVRKWKYDLDKLATKEALINKLHLPRDKKVMLGVGNYIKKKNWKSIIRAIENIEDIFFVLIGEGEEENEYKLMVKELKLGNKVLITGRKNGDELLEYYKASDFFIFPSYYDQFGFVVPEALYSGLPVICSKNTGGASMIKHGVNGYIIDPNDNNEIFIKDAIANIKLLKKGIVSINAISNYTLEDRVDKFFNIFNNLLYHEDKNL